MVRTISRNLVLINHRETSISSQRCNGSLRNKGIRRDHVDAVKGRGVVEAVANLHDGHIKVVVRIVPLRMNNQVLDGAQFATLVAEARASSDPVVVLVVSRFFAKRASRKVLFDGRG